MEKRDLGPAPPVTPPSGPADPRAALFETNRYQMSEGARLFRWAGCGGCHTDPAPARLDLADGNWIHGGRTPEIYTVIAHGAPGMPAMGERLTPQQVWQIAGYLHGLPQLKPEQRRRSDQALAGEPEGAVWGGALP